ncbi:bifunctional 5,10-methylene-tetrahydrofolate dehydrogenase/5,10-methylene-tetrahydrofolate cyclohydrolase [Haloplanus rallus]|jgi:methylenetetrahydrofolate dehydrogenase (NADP+)/methenyltetrahydrofolate cyclohydrolase|uniref:Bifunctional protein FolD n=1 Tax=Haloplanus rallus TaxID=1816183 RepID=A0A6B9FFY2_9EURY|nr:MULTISPECIES: tetrahydrofolate dehydrogenase/cyclohydrolase catalytic domain-containing protein [Haloplanus]QGX96270.1 bifunctional 5,10-methylene-tetrahydrofolate dehydrogenase/5,10-methylene-tetrahydrofolate cyclohydrolase [Haloplanus rallus]
MTDVIDGDAVAADVREGLADAIGTLDDAGVTPTLATVLMSDDPASETYVSMKQQDCAEVGIEARDVELDPEAPAEELFETVADLNADPAVNGILVQMPVPDHVEDRDVIRAIDPAKDVDGFHPENVGRLVAGDPVFKPCTPHGVLKLLDAAGVETEGADVTIVGRSNIVGKPLANLLLQKADDGNATVTVCHSRTEDVSEKTRRADVVIAAAGVPELVDGSMLTDGTVVIDVGVNRVERDGESTLVGDVDFESAKSKARAITPVPGGVGPMTRAMLLYNTVKATSRQAEVPVDL